MRHVLTGIISSLATMLIISALIIFNFNGIKNIFTPNIALIDVDKIFQVKEGLQSNTSSINMMFGSIDRFLKEEVPENTILLNKRVVVNDGNFPDITNNALRFAGVGQLPPAPEIPLDLSEMKSVMNESDRLKYSFLLDRAELESNPTKKGWVP